MSRQIVHLQESKASIVTALYFFFFSSRRRHTRFKCDWSSDVCSSDLADLINGKKVTPPGTTSASWDEVATSFSNGLTAMTMNYHDLALAPNVKGSVAYAVVPMGAGIGPHFGTWMLSVNSFSKNKEWAY